MLPPCTGLLARDEEQTGTATHDCKGAEVRQTGTSLRRTNQLGSLFCLAALAGCDDPATTGHPAPERRIHPVPPAGSVASSSTLHTVLDSQILATLRGTDIREMEQLGVMEGSSLLQFGEIGDAIRDSDGNLLVLDGQASELRWFRNETGRIVAESGRLIGGAGLGPGEFQSPLALAAGSTGLVGVFDSGGRVHLFIPDDQGLRHLRSLQLRMDILDACILGDRLILAGYHADHPGALHVFTDAGDWVRSFGLFYESNNRWVREALHRAEVACLEEAGEVLVAPSFLPEIRKYKVSGSLVWWIALEGLAPILIVETRGGRVGIGPPVGGYHATLGNDIPERQRARQRMIG